MVIPAFSSGLLALMAAAPLPAALVAQPTEPSEFYDHPAYDDSFPTPSNAAVLYAVLPQHWEEMIRGGGWNHRQWWPTDFDSSRPGLEISGETAAIVSPEYFRHEVHQFVVLNGPALDLFRRASLVERCDFSRIEWPIRRPRIDDPAQSIGTTIRTMSRLAMLDARSLWTAQAPRLAANNLAAVIRACRHLRDVYPFAGATTMKTAADEAVMLLDNWNWPESGPSPYQVRELRDALDRVDRADPGGLMAWTVQERRDYAAKLLEEVEAHGSAAHIIERLMWENGLAPRDEEEPGAPGGGLIVYVDEPLPIASMSPERLREVLDDSLPLLDRVEAMMLAGEDPANIEAVFRNSLSDPWFIKPILLRGLPESAGLSAIIRESVDKLRTRLDAIAPQDD
ncbi:MAG: hypothetical protein R3B68_12540 [Phycisphaerales bacterium]